MGVPVGDLIEQEGEQALNDVGQAAEVEGLVPVLRHYGRANLGVPPVRFGN